MPVDPLLHIEDIQVFPVRLPERVSSLDNARIIFRDLVLTATKQGAKIIEVTIPRDYDMERAMRLLGLLNRTPQKCVVIVPREQCSPVLQEFAQKYHIELKVQPT